MIITKMAVIPPKMTGVIQPDESSTSSCEAVIHVGISVDTAGVVRLVAVTTTPIKKK